MTDIDNKLLIKKIKVSERKSRVRLSIAIFISTILAVLTFYYAAMLNKSKAIAVEAEIKARQMKLDYENSRDNLISYNDSLRILLERCKNEGEKFSKEINTVVQKSERTGYLVYMHDETSSGRSKSKLSLIHI